MIDPPRAGLSKNAIKRIIKLAPPLMAYVSCNPSTLARDIKRLEDNYSIRSVRMIDMFPQTYHLEAMAILEKKSEN